MSDYSAVAPPQNFSQSTAFAAALQRAKQVIADSLVDTSTTVIGAERVSRE